MSCYLSWLERTNVLYQTQLWVWNYFFISFQTALIRYAFLPKQYNDATTAEDRLTDGRCNGCVSRYIDAIAAAAAVLALIRSYEEYIDYTVIFIYSRRHSLSLNCRAECTVSLYIRLYFDISQRKPIIIYIALFLGGHIIRRTLSSFLYYAPSLRGRGHYKWAAVSVCLSVCLSPRASS